MNILASIDDISYEDRYGDMVPVHLRDGIHRYVMHGIRPGPYLTAIIENDLWSAVRQGDDSVTRETMYHTFRFFWECCPAECYGSTAKRIAWCAKGGKMGVAA